MLAILFVAASLLAQAFVFRDPETSQGNSQINTFSRACRSEYEPHPADASAGIPADVSAGKSDSSRTPELASNR